MRRCAVMGDTESVQGFAAVGLDIFPCDDPAEAGALLRRLAAAGEPGREEYGVIYLTERLAALLERELDALDGQMLPAVIPIPGVHGNTGAGLERVRACVEKAVGSDILFGSCLLYTSPSPRD